MHNIKLWSDSLEEYCTKHPFWRPYWPLTDAMEGIVYSYGDIDDRVAEMLTHSISDNLHAYYGDSIYLYPPLIHKDGVKIRDFSFENVGYADPTCNPYYQGCIEKGKEIFTFNMVNALKSGHGDIDEINGKVYDVFDSSFDSLRAYRNNLYQTYVVYSNRDENKTPYPMIGFGDIEGLNDMVNNYLNDYCDNVDLHNSRDLFEFSDISAQLSRVSCIKWNVINTKKVFNIVIDDKNDIYRGHDVSEMTAIDLHRNPFDQRVRHMFKETVSSQLGYLNMDKLDTMFDKGFAACDLRYELSDHIKRKKDTSRHVCDIIIGDDEVSSDISFSL